MKCRTSLIRTLAALLAAPLAFADDGVSAAKTFIDYFRPMPIKGALSKDAWGAKEVGPRDISNGLEDAAMRQWNYWDGQILKGPDGKYHLFASRWEQAKGHGDWVNSRAVHAVSDALCGPYLDKGLCWPEDQGGKGHNVTALVLPDGRYAIVVSETRPGTVFVSKSLDGPWEALGTIKGDGLDASNISIMVRPDGDYMIVPRSGRVFISKAADGVLGPYRLAGPSAFAALPGIPALEDPAIFHSGGLYHIIVNSWSTRKAYHLTSKDGKNNWVNRGLAYDPTTDFARYTDGTVNHWHKLERPGVLLENGHVTAVTLAVLDTPKEAQPGNNGHGSKIIVIPFDGVALDRDLQMTDGAQGQPSCLHPDNPRSPLALASSPAAAANSPALERITLSIDRAVLRPVRPGEGTGQLTLTGHYADESRHSLPCADARITARTKVASGNVQVVATEGDRVVAIEGGIATVEAEVVQQGKSFKAGIDVVVAPFFRDYHQTLVMKLFMGMEGDPVERLANDRVLSKKGHEVMCTFDGALEVIRRTDNLTRGMPKIIYLVGWQKGGHDHGYPAWNEVNPKLKRAQDATALDSLRWLIREARQFNTTVSLHINMVDAYQQSPLWNEYVAKDCFAKDENGKLLVAGIQMKGEDMYNVVYPKEWEAGLAQRRMDGLIQMIPELKDGHTIHIDVFIAQRDGGRAISPWHAKPENGGLTPDKYVETQRKIFRHWRDRGFDVTGEGTGWAHPPGEHFVGLQPMSWWYSWNPMEIPECLGARGRTDRGGDGDFRFGSSMHGEDIWQGNWANDSKDNMAGFLGMFCRTTLPWYYLSRLERVKFEGEALYYSEGVVARFEQGKRIIRKGDFVVREDDNLFVPALWKDQEIIAYSRDGYTDKAWQLPAGWSGVKSVDLYQISAEGCVPLKMGVSVTDGKLALSLGKDEAVSISPAGKALSGPRT